MSASAPISIRLTGLDSLAKNFADSPQIVEEHVGKALGLALAHVEMEAKQRTPVDTGSLQGSIGGDGGYSYVKGLSAGIGTNVVYAGYVEGNTKARHKTGQAHYMRDGAEAALPDIQERFEHAMEEIAQALVK